MPDSPNMFSQLTDLPRTFATKFGAVAIGRNEGERLDRCLASISSATMVVYVDSGSTDGSAKRARATGVEIIDLDLNVPFTAARARNAGFARLRETMPELAYVQLIDGDCELIDNWPQRAISFLQSHPDIAAVFGRLRERYPERSVYNWLCDREWDGPRGDVKYCGGIVMVRSAALHASGGFRDDLIAGEEPELCIRLRRGGWRIWRLDTDMAIHDAAMMHFSQWWRRTLRSGYAFAQGVHQYGRSAERYRVRESVRAWFWGLWLPLACVAAGLLAGPWGWASFLIYPLQVLRQSLRNRGPLRDRVRLALFQTVARFAEVMGQLKFLRDLIMRRQSGIIEHK